MRFVDEAARMNHENWNRGGKYENHHGAQEVLSVNPVEGAHGDEQLEPGSEMHKRSIVPLYLGVLSRKGFCDANSAKG